MPGFAVSCRGLGGVVDLDELVAQPALFCHMGRHSGGAVALRGMVPGGYEAVSYTHLTLPTTPYV